MDNVLAQCELPQQDVGGFIDDLGLTLSPGSQSESQALSHPAVMDTIDFSAFDISLDPNFDLGIDTGLLDTFDPLADFGSLDQIEIPAFATTAKRPLEETLDHTSEQADPDVPSPKRACQSLDPTLLVQQVQQRMQLANQSSASAHGTQASAVARTRFALAPQDVGRYAAPVPGAQPTNTAPFLSPYRVSKYYPSAPFLHSRTVNVEVSASALQNRLKNSQRRISVLLTERNRFRDRLLSYCQPDQYTGKLRIDEMEKEITTLRRVTSTQQTRTRNLKAEVQTWQQKFSNLAMTHNKLVADYMASKKSPTLSSQQTPEANAWDNSGPWKGMYEKLLAEHNSMISALRVPGADPIRVLEGHANDLSNNRASPGYPSPSSISSMPNHRPESLAASERPSPIATRVSVPALNTGSGFAVSLANELPGSASSNPLSLDQGDYQGESVSMSRTSTSSQTPNGSTIQIEAVPSQYNQSDCDCSPAVPPKDIVVIDLTDEGAEIVSTSGVPTAQLDLPSNETPLTEFHRAFRAKKLSWMQSQPDHQQAIQPPYNDMTLKGRGMIAPLPQRTRMIRSQGKNDNRSSRAKKRLCQNRRGANDQVGQSPALSCSTAESEVRQDKDIHEQEHNTGDARILQIVEAEISNELNKDPQEEEYNPTDEELVRMMEDQFSQGAGTGPY